MLYINITIILLYIIIFIISNKVDHEWKNNLDKKEHPLNFLYPMANFILTKTGLEKILYRKEKVTASIKALNVTKKADIIQKFYWCNKVSLVITILFLFHVLSLLGQLQSLNSSKVLEGKYIRRPEYGEGNEEIELHVTIDPIGKKDIEGAYKTDSYSEDVTIQLKERSYSETELVKLFDDAVDYLNLSILANNESSELIYDDLYFCEFIPGTSISVVWKPEDISLIARDGKVNNEDIAIKGINTKVTAILSYQDKQIEHTFKFKVFPKNYSEKERLRIKLEEEIKNSLVRKEQEKRVKLPDVLEGYLLSWKDKKQNNSIQILLLGVVAAVLAWYYADQDLNQKMNKRKEQMQLDYPEIINKFTLLVNAGMTVKQAWYKIAQDYEKKIEKGKVKKRYAYEEILVTVHELKLGVPESDAYEQFGRRTGQISYIKFGTFIAQNLKKGNKGLTELLTKEAIEAFEDRKETAKRLGEEAGTKLLVPMMIMLLIVFVIILVPAFLSFGV